MTVPLSGIWAPDGHDEHEGAWVADMWYGDLGLDSAWTNTFQYMDCVKYDHVFRDRRGLPFAASINGIDVTSEFANPGRPTTRFADISMFSGQNVELKFRTSQTSLSGMTGTHDLDSIAFLVPEASSLALLSVGGLSLLAGWLWRTRRARR